MILPWLAMPYNRSSSRSIHAAAISSGLAASKLSENALSINRLLKKQVLEA
jgi:hypothetical protein